MPAMPRSQIAVINSINGGPPVPDKTEHVDTDEASYWARRRGLIAEEKQRRFDAARRAARTDAERTADEALRQLRLQELRDVYERPDDKSIIKGSTWTVAKTRGVQIGTLYKLIQRMPKGAVLHCHMDATVDANWLIAQSYDEQQLFVRAEQPLTTHASMYDTPMAFRSLPTTAGTESDGGFARAEAERDNMYTTTYVPNTWVPLSRARACFPYENIYRIPPPGYEDELRPYRGGKDASATAFDAFLFSKISLTPAPTTLTPPILTSKQAWAHFINTFIYMEGLQTDRIRFDYFVRSFRTAIADNICYVEARFNFFAETFVDSEGHATLSHAAVVTVFERALAAVRAELPKGRLFDAKIIYSTLRFIEPARLQWYIDDAIALKQQFPSRIVGFDLVGWEDNGVTLREYVPALLGMRKRCIELGVELPFCFHAGETLGDGDAIDDNLYDALLLGSRRLGHAFSLSRHPVLVEAVRTKQVCIESCPISNQVLRYNDTHAMHPVLTMLAYGCPVALSNDDMCQFLNPGLSPDFYSILIASDHFDLTSLAVLAQNSLEHTLNPDAAHSKALLDAWHAAWAAFVEEVAALAAPTSSS